MTKTRMERDTFGPIAVPGGPLLGRADRTLPAKLPHRHGTHADRADRALAIVKRAAAEVNHDLGLLDRRRMRAIVQAADEIIAGKLDDHFPLVVWQTGSGTQPT